MSASATATTGRGNLLVSEDKTTLTVLDWETVRRGCGATDVGTFAAESFLLDTFRGNRGLVGHFLQAYRDGVGAEKLTLRFAERVAAHFGTHLGFWIRNKWGSRRKQLEWCKSVWKS